MVSMRKAILLLCSLLLVFVIAGCKKEGPAERAGKKVDKAVEKAGDKFEEAGDKVKEATEK